MKIVHFFHHFLPCTGGIEKVILEYCRGAKKNGFTAKVVCLNKCYNSKKILPEKETIEGIEVERLPFIDLKYYKIAFGVTRKIGDADIIHLHGLNFFSDCVLLLKPFHKKNIVLTTYGGVFHTKSLSAIKNLYFFIWSKWLLKRAERIIAISENDFQLFSKIVPREKLVLMEIGADVEAFSKISKKTKGNTFLCLGRLAKNKGLEELLNVFRMVVEKNNNARLLIAGKDFDGTEKRLLEMIKQNTLEKNIFLLGEISNEQVKKLLAETEFFVSASKYESFGISAVEAMASGLIPLLSPLPTFKNFVEQEKSGFIIDFSDVEKSGKKILEIMNLNVKRKKEISENAKKQAMKYSWGNRVQELVKLYEKIIH